jgi:hypothetical protein
MVHFLRGSAAQNEAVTTQLLRLDPAHRRKVLRTVEVDGVTTIVTRFILDMVSFGDWLQIGRAEALPAPDAVPPGSGGPSLPPPDFSVAARPEEITQVQSLPGAPAAATPTEPGEFTRMFANPPTVAPPSQPVQVPQQTAPQPPAPLPPAPLPPAPLPPAPLGAQPNEPPGPGEFTRMFGAPQVPPADSSREAAPPRSPPAAPPMHNEQVPRFPIAPSPFPVAPPQRAEASRPASAVPGSAEWQFPLPASAPRAASNTPSSAPPGPPAPPAFQRGEAGQPPFPHAAQPPGEYTKMFGGPVVPQEPERPVPPTGGGPAPLDGYSSGAARPSGGLFSDSDNYLARLTNTPSSGSPPQLPGAGPPLAPPLRSNPVPGYPPVGAAPSEFTRVISAAPPPGSAGVFTPGQPVSAVPAPPPARPAANRMLMFGLVGVLVAALILIVLVAVL